MAYPKLNHRINQPWLEVIINIIRLQTGPGTYTQFHPNFGNGDHGIWVYHILHYILTMVWKLLWPIDSELWIINYIYIHIIIHQYYSSYINIFKYIYIYVYFSLSSYSHKNHPFNPHISTNPWLPSLLSLHRPHLKDQKRGEMDWLPTITASCHTKRSDLARSIEFLGNWAEKHRKNLRKLSAKTQISGFLSCHVKLLGFVWLKAMDKSL